MVWQRLEKVLKSPGALLRTGSIPVPGTNEINHFSPSLLGGAHPHPNPSNLLLPCTQRVRLILTILTKFIIFLKNAWILRNERKYSQPPKNSLGGCQT
jgi:hypothetical protein